MWNKTRILILAASPWNCSRILVDEEAREIFVRLQEGPYRDKFELHFFMATRPRDLQWLLLKYRPHIVHFSGHGHKTRRIILGGAPGRGKTVDTQGLAHVFALYRRYLRLVVLNACFTDSLARSITKTVDYSIGTSKAIGDKAGVAFAGAFYRGLGFGNSVKEAFASAKAELGLTRMPRAQGIELFVRNDIDECDSFPRLRNSVRMFRSSNGLGTDVVQEQSTRSIHMPARRRDALERRIAPGFVTVSGDCGACTLKTTGDKTVTLTNETKQTIGQNSTQARNPLATTLRKHKAPGTRVGILEDWRSVSNGKGPGRAGKTLRDGR